MEKVNEFRDGLIPFGNCVYTESGQEAIADAFAATDRGNSDPRLLQIAKKGCETCVQFAGYCNDDAPEQGQPPQRTLIAEELWRRGAGIVCVGGEINVRAAAGSDAYSSPPILRFDLSRIPEDRRAALAILRQGVRAGQLRISGAEAKVSREIADGYLEALKAGNPGFYQSLVEADDAPGGIEVGLGLKYILSAMFQQRDFQDFINQKSKSDRSAHPRYDMRLFDPDADAQLLTLHLEELQKIHSLGYSKPSKKAMQFDAAFYKTIKANFFKDTISWAEFDYIVTSNPRNPVQALMKRNTLRTKIRQQNEDSPEHYVRMVARMGADADLDGRIQELRAEYEGRPQVTPALIRAACVTSPAHAKEFLEGVLGRVEAAVARYGEHDEALDMGIIRNFANRYRSLDRFLGALATCKQNFEELKAYFDEDMPVHIIKTLSRICSQSALETAKDFQERCKRIESESDGTLPSTMIRNFAVEGLDSFEAVQLAHRRKALKGRFNARAAYYNGQAKKIPAAGVDRMLALYPAGEVDAVAEGVYSLINAGLLLVAHKEDEALTPPNYQQALDKIFCPKTHAYVTWSTAAMAWTPEERVFCAEAYGLMSLLYGAPSCRLQIEQYAFHDEKTVQDYRDEVVASRGVQFRSAVQADKPVALPVSQLCDDLIWLDQFIAGNEPDGSQAEPREFVTLRGLHDATLVVGGKVLRLTARPNSDTPRNKLIAEWLEQKTASVYPPHLQEAALGRLQDLLEHGVLEVTGTHQSEFRAALSHAFYGAGISDLERAMAAHEIGADHLLYGRDLAPVLRHRLGGRVIQVRRSARPRVLEIEIETADELAARPQPAGDLMDAPAKERDNLQQYLNEIGKIPLVDAEQEAELAKRIEAGLFAKTLLERNDFRLATQAELEVIAEDGGLAKDQLLCANLRFVVSLAKKFQGRGMDLPDLIQEGNLGLIQAVRKFDYKLGYKFSTYAVWWIRQAMSKAITDQGRMIRLPVDAHEAINKLNPAIEAWKADHGGALPTPEQLADSIGVSVETLRRAIAAKSVVSTNMLVGDSEDTEFGELIEDASTAGPLEHVLAVTGIQNVTKMLRTLYDSSKVARELLPVFILRNGLVVDGPETFFGADARQRIHLGRPHTLEEINAIVYNSRSQRATVAERSKKAQAFMQHPAVRAFLADILD